VFAANGGSPCWKGQNMKLFDSHAHYEDAMFDRDRDECLSRLEEDGIQYVLNCCSDVSVFETVLSIVETYPAVYGSIGVHPHWVQETPQDYLKQIAACLSNPKIKAVGEMGLDYFYDDPKDLQKRIFKEQLALAKDFDLPVIIHDRLAHEDCIRILKEYRPCGVLHRYGGPVELLQEAFSWGMYVSFSNDLTYPEWNQPHIDCLLAAPWDRILVETDCPYTPPKERENDRCLSKDVKTVVETIARLRHVSEEFVAERTLENAMRLYRIS